MTEERPAYPSLENRTARHRTLQAIGRDGTTTKPASGDCSDRKWPTYWITAASLLEWSDPYERIVDKENEPFYRWFVGGSLNAAENCIDRIIA
ncbi:acetyl-coenzyme A synthetase N-terminal domain-containing protein [Natrialba taiwanensis]|uniref:Acyl-CoA synthetase n=1 Tax=Natrialba taiwanensis DSM 12281 TaxID=1230458 RepID=M0A5A7_9EURY|nr:acyl-CoA synthetase [Natrialba taiwanensis DSM 12281]